MRDSYYKILKLSQNQNISIEKNSINVSIDKITEKNWICNDSQLLKNIHPNNYFFISGGGTYLVLNRFLIVVKRSSEAFINPGKISLFTGRAEGPLEWKEPWRVVRELFEELILFSGSKILYPRNNFYQEIIDTVYQNHFNTILQSSTDHLNLFLTEKILKNQSLKISTRESINEISGFIHINSRKEINFLVLFEIDVDLESLAVLDVENGKTGREVFFFDLETHSIAEISGSIPTFFHRVSRSDMSEQLCAMVDALIEKTMPKNS